MQIKLTKTETAFFYIEESAIHGIGLFARIEINIGTHIGDFKGPQTTRDGMHVLWIEDAKGKWVGRNGKNALRYLNHHVNPTAEFDGFGLYALKKIKMHQEITIDYGEEP